jgi:hypothetical protein
MKTFLCSCLLLGSLGAWSFAGIVKESGGLRANYSKIVVDNLPIGCDVSMKKIVNLPLKIGNQYKIPIEANITIRAPKLAREGYEPIPSVDWIKTEAAMVEIPPLGERQVDVVIAVPDDETLLGRRFQADVIVTTAGDKNFRGVHTGYEITGCLLFSVAPVRNEKALQYALENPADAAFLLDPPRVDLFNVKPGQLVTVTSPQEEPIKLINESSVACPYHLEPIAASKSTYKPDVGSQVGAPEDIQLGFQDVSLDPNGSTNITISIQVPKDAKLSQGPRLYQVSVRSGKTRALEQYIKIYLWGRSAPQNPVVFK